MEDNKPVSTCLKMDLRNNTVRYIAEIPQNTTLTKPASIVVDSNLYVFDCYSETQSIYKYSIDHDGWATILMRTKGNFVMPRSLKGFVFRKDDYELIYFSGLTDTPEERSNFYFYDLRTDKFISYKQDNT